MRHPHFQGKRAKHSHKRTNNHGVVSPALNHKNKHDRWQQWICRAVQVGSNELRNQQQEEEVEEGPPFKVSCSRYLKGSRLQNDAKNTQRLQTNANEVQNRV